MRRRPIDQAAGMACNDLSQISQLGRCISLACWKNVSAVGLDQACRAVCKTQGRYNCASAVQIRGSLPKPMRNQRYQWHLAEGVGFEHMEHFHVLVAIAAVCE